MSEEQFQRLEKTSIQSAPSLCDGHVGTTVWYVKDEGYVIEVNLSSDKKVLVESICTFTPTFGMDSIDGMFAEDVEEYILKVELGRPTSRLDVFGNRESVPVQEYLASRGMEVNSEATKKQPWWKFW